MTLRLRKRKVRGMKIQLPPKLKCLRCGKEWTPRKSEVRICPSCKSAYWDTPKPEKQRVA